MPEHRHPSFFSREEGTAIMQPGTTSSDARGHAGFTLIELLIVVAIIAAVAAIAVPSLLRARMAANETSALGSMRAVNSAQTAYASAASAGGYASDLNVLAQSCPGSNLAFITPDLAGDPAQKSGYNVRLAAGTQGPGPLDCNGTASNVGYYLTAVPVTIGLTGHRGFAATSPAVIYFTHSGAAPTEAEMLPGGGGTPIQ
jgi:type IV pilus assembly protein PilA